MDDKSAFNLSSSNKFYDLNLCIINSSKNTLGAEATVIQLSGFLLIGKTLKIFSQKLQ